MDENMTQVIPIRILIHLSALMLLEHSHQYPLQQPLWL